MNSGTPYIKRNPEERANLISRLFFWWSKELFWKGAHKDLQQSDLYHVVTSDESERLTDRLERYWKLELERPKMIDYTEDLNGNKKRVKRKKTARLHVALIRAFWVEYACVGAVYGFLTLVLQIVQPLLQGLIISYFDVNAKGQNVTNAQALAYAGCLIVCIIMSIFILHQTSAYSQRIGMRVRVACSSLVYRKTLQLSSAALTQTTGGQIINLLSNDVNRFDQLLVYLHYIWIMPIQLAIIAYIMWDKVGNFAFIGVGMILFLSVPFNTIFTIASQRLRRIIANLTDTRIQFTDELVAGIQVIKMYAWEIPFAKIVSNTRKVEIKKIQLASYVRAIYVGIMVITERVTLYLTLVPYVLMGNTLHASVTYILASYFNVLQLSGALFFPQALLMYGETMISIKRLEEFLLLEEVEDEDISVKWRNVSNGIGRIGSDIELKRKQITLPKYEKFSSEDLHEVRPDNPVSVNLDRVCANWSSNQLPPTLCNISMNVKSGQLCALVGAVGSGKSSLLHLLLREIPLGAGTIRLLQNSHVDTRHDKRGYVTDNPNLRISYASQEPWLFGGTVRENILFGQPFERSRYVAVTRACALTRDFRQLPYGDMSVVGERGASLSGGQRARVNLARAVYRQADLYLLDDPLSAVDTHVAKHLFKKCIEDYLRGKTRILVTHQLQFLERVDHIVAVDRGVVKMQGTYADLSQSNQEFLDMVNCSKITKERDKMERSGSERQSRRSSRRKRSSAGRTSFRGSVKSIDSSDMGSEDNDCNFANRDNQEGMGTGGLSYKVYAEYFRAGSSCFVLCLLILITILAQVSSSGVDSWLSYWSNLEMVRSNYNTTPGILKVHQYMFNDTFLAGIFTLGNDGLLSTTSAIYMYTFCVATCIFFVTFRSFFFMKICMNSSQNLYNTMFANVLLANMSFFHHNSSGRILNRFSKDVGVMDEWLPKVFLEAVQISLVMIGVLVMEAVINVWMLIPLVILSGLLYVLSNFYLKTAQNVKRIEGVTKSPVFSHINATINGLPTIRSSGEEIKMLLKKQFDKLQDIHSGAWYLTFTAASAFGLVIDVIAVCFVICVCFSLILLNEGSTLGGNVGLAISQSLILVVTLQYGIKQSVMVISQMTAIERIIQYTKLPAEGSMTSDNPPPPDWPPKGRLCFKSVNLRYEMDEPPVLKDLNVTIEAGWKVGVVGRTGAGKSSLISVIFRLFAEGLEGEVSIDGKDTATLGLQELRSRISIIPQEPVLFSRSLRYNLDPFEQYSDTMLWDVLRKVELNDSILDQKVQQSGSNFSVGQRQLICLARAILRNNRILVLDEATANVDSYTDSLIQQTIRDKFEECTVLTIAHRLHTIIDSDRIIVMEAGRIVEFGCPHELLHNNPKGYFSQMVDKTGREMSQILREQAQKFCEKNTAQRSLEFTRQNSTESDRTFTASL
ncbi:hypothetical protein KM043_009360 [Ampulex compressa]|nr:hypothetical protein KM043_009360 [Ampulex compressa]